MSFFPFPFLLFFLIYLLFIIFILFYFLLSTYFLFIYLYLFNYFFLGGGRGLAIYFWPNFLVHVIHKRFHVAEG